MVTKESIDNKAVDIDWEFSEVIDTHDSNWCEWALNGTDKEGNKYTATCEADKNNPSDLHSNIENVEALTD